jgi:short subunit dehydrogenase-like uncharacterized protein
MKFGSRARAIGVTTALGLFESAVRLPFTRRLLEPLLPKPGSGPSEATMRRGRFRAEFIGLGGDGRTARVVVRDTGDPANAVTVKCLCESALALVLDEAELPGGPARGGVLTPATAFGAVLVRRLRAANMTIELVPT